MEGAFAVVWKARRKSALATALHVTVASACLCAACIAQCCARSEDGRLVAVKQLKHSPEQGGLKKVTAKAVQL